MGRMEQDKKRNLEKIQGNDQQSKAIEKEYR